MARHVPVLLLAAGGCSLSTYEFTPCDSDATCRSTFGWGYTCSAETSLCEEVEISNRCETSYPEDLLTDRAKYKDAIVLGAVLERGRHKDSDDEFSLESEMQAFELPIRQVADYSGLNGTEFGLIECSNEESSFYDDMNQDDASITVAHHLSYDIGVPAILGPEYSSAANAVYVEVAPNGTLVMSHSATSPALITIDGASHSDADPGLFWRTCPPDSLQGAAIASDMAGRDIADVAVIYDTGSYGIGLAGVFSAEFEALGGSAELYQFETDSQLSDYITTVGNSGAQEVLFIASDSAVIEDFLLGASTPAFEDKGIFLTDAAYYEEVFTDTYELAQDLFPNIRGTRPTVDKDAPAYQQFKSSYQQAFSEDPDNSGFASHAFDATWLVLYGTAWSWYRTDEVSGLGIAKGLRHISYASTETYQVETNSLDWNTVQSAFKDGLSIDVTGASGSLDYDGTTGETTAAIEVWTVSCDGSDCTFNQEDIIEPEI